MSRSVALQHPLLGSSERFSKRSSMGWGIDIGPIHVGDDGVRARTPEEMASDVLGIPSAGIRAGAPVVADVFSAIPGIGPIAADALRGTVKGVENAISSINTIVQYATGKVNAEKVRESLTKTAQSVSNVFVLLNPSRNITNLLQENPVTAHAFAELDKFTGGMVTSSVNVSDLVYRVGRGDAITKQELVRDAIFLIQVAALATGGGAAAGAMVGNWIGKEVCKNQTDNKDTCRAVFVAVGAASGAAVGTALEEYSKASAEDLATKNFTDYLSDAAVKTFTDRVFVDESSKIAVLLCQKNQWMGTRECAILGRIAADYVKYEGEMSWSEFLAYQAGVLGVELLMEQAFPPGSKEREALNNVVIRQNPTQISYPVPVYYQYQQQGQGASPILLLAGAAAFALIVGGS